MKSTDNGLGSRFGPILVQREAELRAILHAGILEKSHPADTQDSVSDFKDMAAESSRELVADAKADQAAQELEQVLSALRRVREGRYGECLDCGDAIDERRLMALPAAPYCIACQAVHEQTWQASRHRAQPERTR